MTGYGIRRVKSREVRAALALVWEVFSAFEAPLYGPEGAENFRRDIVANPRFIADCRLGRCPLYGAFDGDEIIGLMGLRPSRDHINLAFVKKEYQRQGVATALFHFLLADLLRKDPGLPAITLNSSPYGLPFYLHLGFVATAEEQEVNGIRFTPMRYDIPENQI